MKEIYHRRSHLVHRGTPKVIEKYIFEGCMRSEIAIILNRWNIVKHEATTEAVGINCKGESGHNRRESSSRRHSHHKYIDPLVFSLFCFSLDFLFYRSTNLSTSFIFIYTYIYTYSYIYARICIYLYICRSVYNSVTTNRNAYDLPACLS